MSLFQLNIHSFPLCFWQFSFFNNVAGFTAHQVCLNLQTPTAFLFNAADVGQCNPTSDSSHNSIWLITEIQGEIGKEEGT